MQHFLNKKEKIEDMKMIYGKIEKMQISLWKLIELNSKFINWKYYNKMDREKKILFKKALLKKKGAFLKKKK